MIVGMLVFMVACDGGGLANVEQGERRSALYRRAIAAEQSGDVKGAIELLTKLLIEQPQAFSAHFQLATLLHDHEEDYIGAIYHYKQYLFLRPDSDKSALTRDRIRIAEQLLAPQILRKVGDSVQGITQAHLLQENTRLNRIITTLEGEKVSNQEQKTVVENELKVLKAEVVRLREILTRMRVSESEISAGSAIDKQEVKKAETTALRSAASGSAKKTTTKNWRALREEAAALAAEGEASAVQAPVRDETLSAAEMLKNVQKRLEAQAEVAEAPVPKTDAQNKTSSTSIDKPTLEALNPFAKKEAREKAGAAKTEMRTYVVQPGDTLFQIAEKHYGDPTHWKRIRDANRTRIDPDGRVRAGQIILVPSK